MSDQQLSLFYHRQETKGLLCLSCPLAECNESDPLCLYREAKDRKTYYREHYKANREKRLEAAKEWQRKNKPWKQKDRREYYARYHQTVRKVKDSARAG